MARSVAAAATSTISANGPASEYPRPIRSHLRTGYAGTDFGWEVADALYSGSISGKKMLQIQSREEKMLHSAEIFRWPVLTIQAAWYLFDPRCGARLLRGPAWATLSQTTSKIDLLLQDGFVVPKSRFSDLGEICCPPAL